MDELVILDEGRIVERGAHDDLLSKAGVYATLWTHQSGGFLPTWSPQNPYELTIS
jgi:ATP-binding cassette subfamily B multidrug efflux pump